MSSYTMQPVADFRNEGWTITGASSLFGAWGSGVDTEYASNPPNKGRAAISFEQDISNSNIPDSATIESVTISVRAEATDTTTRRLTVNMLSADDTSYFTCRSIVLPTTPTTMTVATYTQDAQNRAWTKDTLNQLILQVFTYDSGASVDKVRVYELQATVNFRTVPSVQITAPSGTVTQAAPVVSFTYTQSDGDIQQSAAYKIFDAAQVADPTFSPDYTPAVYPPSQTYVIQPGDTLWAIAGEFLGDPTLWPQIYAASHFRSGDPNLIYPGEVATIPGVSAVVGDVQSFTLPYALAQGDYFIFLQVTSTRGAVSDWASREFIVAGASPGIPGGSLAGVGTGGSGAFESVIADPQTSNIFLTVRDSSNLLGVQQSNFETLTDSLGWTGVNCVPEQDLTVAYDDGGASMKIAATAAGDMSVVSDWIDVAAAAPGTFSFQVQPVTTGRTVDLSIAFADENFSSVDTPITASGTDTTDTWTQILSTDWTVPNDAVYAQATITVKSAAASEVHNLDHLGLMYGVNASWSSGGHASRNLLSNYESTGDSPTDDPAWTANSASSVEQAPTSGTGSQGLGAFKMTYLGQAGTITEVGVAAVYTQTAVSDVTTINKPSGVANGDVLVAYVASDGVQLAGAPTGWTLVNQTYNGEGSSLSVLMRDGLAADPSSWTADFTGNTGFSITTCVAYRGAASTSSQFQNNNIDYSLSGSDNPQTPNVTCPDANAWRLSAFSVNGSGSGGALTANTDPPSNPEPIRYVGISAIDQQGSAYNFNIYKPGGTQQGDFMLAMVCGASSGSFSTPSGWTLLDSIVTNTGYGDTTQAVMYRFAGADEPNSWDDGVINSVTHITRCVAYRNVDTATPFLSHGNQVDNTATFSTPSEHNSNSHSWWVAGFADVTNGGSGYSNWDGYMRSNDSNDGDDRASHLGIFDSDGTISTGDWSATVSITNDTNMYSSAAWIGILNRSSAGTSPGANDTTRMSSVVGSGPYMTLGVFDSNGTDGTTSSETIYGTYTPGGSVNSACGWLGFLVPGTPSTNGQVGVDLTNYIDLRRIDPVVMALAGNTVTVQSEFLGSSAGGALLTLYAYTGSSLISTQTMEGNSFGTTVWAKSLGQFALPNGATRLKVGLSALNRNVNDYVLFDRVSVALGAQTVWRPGTGETAHPILDAPLVEYAEDLGTGYGDWITLPGFGSAPLVYDNDTGLCQITDQTATPGAFRKYRARTISYGIEGDTYISDYGPESAEVQLLPLDWWLKDFTTPELSLLLKVYVYQGGSGQGGTSIFQTTTTDSSASFQPLGEPYPIVVTEGYKGDTFAISVQVDSDGYQALMQLLNQQHTMLLQSNFDQSWWVRPYGNITSDLQATDMFTSSPLRFVTVPFIQVAPEA